MIGFHIRMGMYYAGIRVLPFLPARIKYGRLVWYEKDRLYLDDINKL